jgi:hypothetical protein
MLHKIVFDIYNGLQLLKSDNKLFVGQDDSFSTASVRNKIFQIAGEHGFSVGFEGEQRFSIELDDEVCVLESTPFAELTNVEKFKIILSKMTGKNVL